MQATKTIFAMMARQPIDSDIPEQARINQARRRFGAVTMGLHVAMRQCLAALGAFLIAMAIPIGILTPFLPIGLPLAIIGVVLLGRNAVWGRRWMEGMLDRHPRLEHFAPNWLMRAVFGRDKRPRS